jgi:hypothetical protein
MGTIRNRGKKIILYPIFLECSKICKDEYWSNLYEDFAIGKFPKRIYISGNTVYIGSKSKNNSYNFSEKNPETICRELHDYITQNTNIYSSQDIINRRKIFDSCKKRKESANIETFKQITKKFDKEMIIMNFVINKKNTMNLSWSQAKDLLHTIKIGFLNHTLRSEHIILKGKQGKIDYIEGLEFNNGLWEITNSDNIQDQKFILDDNYMNQLWNNKYKSRKK